MLNLFYIILILLVSCSTRLSYQGDIPTTGKNFHSRSHVYSYNYSLWNGVNIGKDKSCFPYNLNKICRNYHYDKTVKVNAELYNIRIDGIFRTSADKMEDFIYLAAAEVVQQEHFNYFTVISHENSAACTNYTSENTSGSYNSYTKSYSATTTRDTERMCSSGVKIDIIAFNNPKILEKGILKEYYSSSRGVFYRPLFDLYNTKLNKKTFPVIYKYILEPDEHDSKNVIQFNRYIPSEAWKQYYNAKQIVQKTLHRYNLSGRRKYKIRERSRVKRQKSIREQSKKRIE